MVKNLPAMQETQVWSLDGGDQLEKGMAMRDSILAWRIPWTEEPGGLQSMWLQRIRHDWVTNTHAAAAATAKSLQSCLTLCDPIDGSPPGSPVPGILQARTLGWVAISFSNAWKWKVKVKSLSRVWLLATPWTAAHQAPPSMGFSRQEYWSGVPLPSPHIQYCYIYKDIYRYTYTHTTSTLSTHGHLDCFHNGTPPWNKQSLTSCNSSSSQSVQLLSRVPLFVTPWIATCQASLSITNSQSSLKLSSSSRSSTRDDSTGSFPGGTVVKNPPANVGDARECRFYPWIKKIPQSRKWSPNPVSLLGKSHG